MRLDVLFGEIDQTIAEVKVIIDELEKQDPYFEGILDRIDSVRSQNQNMIDAKNQVALFSFFARAFLTSEQFAVEESCVLKGLRLASLKSADIIFSNVLLRLQQNDQRLDGVIAALNMQDGRLEFINQATQDAFQVGIISRDQANIIVLIIQEIDAAFNQVSLLVSEADKLIVAQIPEVISAQIDNDSISRSAANTDCYNLVLGSWTQTLPTFNDTYCLKQNKLTISGYQITARAGDPTQRYIISGTTRNDSLSLRRENDVSGPTDFSFRNPNTSRAEICFVNSGGFERCFKFTGNQC